MRTELFTTSAVILTPGSAPAVVAPGGLPSDPPRFDADAPASAPWPESPPVRALPIGLSCRGPPVRRSTVERVAAPELGAIWLAAESRLDEAPPPKIDVSNSAICFASPYLTR